MIPWAPVTGSLAPEGSAPRTLILFPQGWRVLPGTAQPTEQPVAATGATSSGQPSPVPTPLPLVLR